MAQFPNNGDSYPFVFPSTSTNVYRGESSSLFGWSNPVQDLASRMEALMLSNPYNIYTGAASGDLYSGLRNQGTNLNIVDEAALYRIRVANAARAEARNRVHGFFDDRVVQYNYTQPRGRLARDAKDPCACRSLQRKIEQGTPEEINVIIYELKDHLHDLIKHPFGNYVILKFFQTTNVSSEQVNAVFFLIINNAPMLQDVCMDERGNRVIQKILENVITPNRICAFMNAMKSIFVALMNSVNGGFVMQQCVKLFPPEYKKVILDEIASYCLDIARDKSGCCSIQKCLNVATDQEEAMGQVVAEIISNVTVLADDPYGNYVVQFLAKLRLASVNEIIISKLCGSYVRLSMNKFASNVVEDLLTYSETKDAAVIVLELMQSFEFLDVLQDPFGNYVAQKAVQYIKGSLGKRLCNKILSLHEELHSHIYGKRVLSFTKTHCSRVRA
ncbi:hypothetical protein VNO77_12290 [Canavalia gladiata]|uniref:PUM-HD domain-containing protein n=1 Tax=Canavalia gladiata TaxID=3824 RepID=A0AAN9QPN1_CANGL